MLIPEAKEWREGKDGSVLIKRGDKSGLGMLVKYFKAVTMMNPANDNTKKCNDSFIFFFLYKMKKSKNI